MRTAITTINFLVYDNSATFVLSNAPIYEFVSESHVSYLILRIKFKI